MAFRTNILISPLLTTILLALIGFVCAGSGTIKLTVTEAKARQCPGVRTNEKIVMAKNGFSYLQSGKSRKSAIKVVQTADRREKHKVLEFPSCYDFQFYMYIRKPLNDPEAKLNVWLLNSLYNVNCSATDLGQVSRQCDRKRNEDPDSRACRVCDVCDNIKDLDRKVLGRSRTNFISDCGRRCCFEPKLRPYRFKVEKLCLSQYDISKMFEDVNLRQYLNQQKRLFGRKGKDSIRLRLEFTDTDSRLRRVETIGCFEVTMDFTVNGF